LLDGYCKVAGYPFRYQNFSIDQIDSYQGKSGQNAKAFIDAVLDPSVIGLAPSTTSTRWRASGATGSPARASRR
jgi:hypothetical protein